MTQPFKFHLKLARTQEMVTERLSITFTSNGKRDFVTRDQLSFPINVFHGSLFLHLN